MCKNSPIHSQIDKVDVSNYLDYFKFAIVRNPFDRLFSWYNMIIQKGVHNTWSDYILKNSRNFSEFLELTGVIQELNHDEIFHKQIYLKSISINQIDYLSIKGKLAVDFVGRFENIDQDIKIIQKEIGVFDELKHLNCFNHRRYTEYFSDLDIEKAKSICEKDIEFFNYEFGS